MSKSRIPSVPTPHHDKHKMPADGKEFAAPDYSDLQHALCGLYTREVAPIESLLRFGSVGTASYTAAEFRSKPIVFILGQYSVGKTTSLRYAHPT